MRSLSKLYQLMLALAAVAFAVGAQAQDDVAANADDRDADAEDRQDAAELVDEAITVVNQMKSDPELMQQLDEAKGVFIVPDYAQAGIVVGGEGGEGVVLMRQGDQPGAEWSPPAFYNFGGVTAGAEIGVEVGSIAMLLMSDAAVEQFKTQENNFSLDASAGLSIIDWSAKAEVSAGRGDVIVWSDTEGVFAGATIGISDINQDEDENAAFYGPNVDAEQILSGNIQGERAQDLREALSS